MLLLICFSWCLEQPPPSFGRTCLLCLHSLDLLSSFFAFFLFFVFLGSGLFIFNSRPHAGIVIPSLLCPDVASSTSCLGCSFVCGGVCAAFLREPRGGLFGHGQPGGVNVFFGFSHNRDVWVKTGAVPQGEGFRRLFASKRCILEVETDGGFQFCRTKRYKNRDFKFFKMK